MVLAVHGALVCPLGTFGVMGNDSVMKTKVKGY